MSATSKKALSLKLSSKSFRLTRRSVSARCGRCGDNRTSSIDDSCLNFEREMSRSTSYRRQQYLNLAQANLASLIRRFKISCPWITSKSETSIYQLIPKDEPLMLGPWDEAYCIANLPVDGCQAAGLSLQSCDESSTLSFPNGICNIDGTQLSCALSLDTAANDSRETLLSRCVSRMTVPQSERGCQIAFSSREPRLYRTYRFNIDSVSSREIAISFMSPTDYVLPRGGPAGRYDLRWMIAPTRPSLIGMTLAKPRNSAQYRAHLTRKSENLVVRGPKPEDDVIRFVGKTPPETGRL